MDINKNVLIIADLTFNAKQLIQQFADCGYRIIYLSTSTDISAVADKHIKLIILLSNNPEFYASIWQAIQSLNELSHCRFVHVSQFDSLSNNCPSEQLCIQEYLPSSEAIEWLESRIQVMQHADYVKPDKLFSDPHGQTENSQSFHQFQRPAISRFKLESALTVLDESANVLELDKNINLLAIAQEQDRLAKLTPRLDEIVDLRYSQLCINNPSALFEQWPIVSLDIILADIQLIRPLLIPWLANIRCRNKNVKLILLYESNIPNLTDEVIRYGITGLLKADASAELFAKALKTVARGELWLPHVVVGQIIATFSQHNSFLEKHHALGLSDLINRSVMTRREICVMELVVQGLSNKAIGKQLAISPETVKKHLKNIYEKAGVHNRSMLISQYK